MHAERMNKQLSLEGFLDDAGDAAKEAPEKGKKSPKRKTKAPKKAGLKPKQTSLLDAGSPDLASTGEAANEPEVGPAELSDEEIAARAAIASDLFLEVSEEEDVPFGASEAADDRWRYEMNEPAEPTREIDLSTLNPPQREAAASDGGPTVVFAGAGSGKTRVITTRIARLLAEGRAKPWQILAVTFTNKAAIEMRERVQKLVASGTRGLRIGTFHSMCARLLRDNAEACGLKRDFTIYDDQDQRALIKRISNDLAIDTKRFPPKSIQNAINRSKQELQGPDEFHTEGNPFRELIRKVFREYEHRMRRASALDFGDLIYRMVISLKKNRELRTELSDRFVHIMVDEFQDTNHSQLRLVQLLAEKHRNLFVVGDDDQSIYRWRGADRRNILDFQRAYPDAQIIKLEQNYRSTARILRVAHAVIRRNSEREPKEMWTENPEGEKVIIVRCEDERDEARMVVRGAIELQNKGESLDEVAVFYRTHAQSRALEEALLRADIPYRIVGGVRFFDRVEVKDALGYLRVIHNPDDDISVLRVINTPTRGIGKRTIERLLEDAATRGVGVWQAVLDVEENAALANGTKKKVIAFRTLMQELMNSNLQVDELLGQVLDRTGYVELLRAEDTPEADARIENLEELAGSIALYVQENDEPTLSGFLEAVTLASDPEAEDATERVTLMTVHAAKGLEFNTVMVTGLEERLFPRAGTELGEDQEELEEERRLAYVAFTRAREQLILSHASVRRLRGRFEVCEASRFLSEVPAADAMWIGGKPARKAVSASQLSSFQKAPAAPPKRDPHESYIDYGEGSDLSGLSQLKKGSLVRHKRFGVGEVRSVEMGSVPKARVVFPGWGQKNIAIQFLQPA